MRTRIRLLAKPEPMRFSKDATQREQRHGSAKLYEAYRHFCHAIGRKPQSTNAFKKALDKLTGVYQSRTSSGMQWSGIKPVTQF